MFPVYTLWKHWRACGSLVFSGDMEWERWPEMNLAQQINISNKSKDTSSKKKKKKSIAPKKMKKFSSLFLSLFVH